MNTRRAAIGALTALFFAVSTAPAVWARVVTPAPASKAMTAKHKPLVKPGGGLGDGITADKVRHILIIDRRFDPSNIKVVSSSGTVALNGTVANTAARAFAQSDAQKAPGVRRVINRLKVAP